MENSSTTREMAVSQRLLLRSLGYPQADSFSLSDAASFRDLVFDLEDKWIRARAVEKRAPLKASDAREWNADFSKYLEQDAECPLAYKPGQNEGDVLDWLLRLAVSYAYDDAGGGEENGHPSEHATAAAQTSFTDWDTPATQQALQQLCSRLRLDLPPNASAGDQLWAAKTAVESQILPALERGSSTDKAGHTTDVLEAYMAQLGFTTNDRQVDRAATLLRLLFLRDLRQLQSQVDEALVAVQEFTQNPRSNAALGVTGR